MTKIEWTDATWNPVTGCTKIQAGCKNCYAERMSKRLAGRYGYPPAPDGFKVTCHEDKLNEPLKWKKPRMIFICSMGDLFHEDVPREFIKAVMGITVDCPQHTFQILTKRPERMCEFTNELNGFPPNVWLGTSVSTQADADANIPWLLKTPAAVRFVSYEPALEKIDFTSLQSPDYHENVRINCLNGKWKYPNQDVRFETGIDWMIMGCESGSNARYFCPLWARIVRNDCRDAEIPFFLKQMPVNGKITKMPKLDGKVWDQMPEVTE